MWISVERNSRQPWSRLEFFLSLFTLGRTRFGKNLGSFKNFHLEPLRDINKPLSRLLRFLDFGLFNILSDFSHKSFEIFPILGEISQLFSTLVHLKVNLMRQFWENTNPRKVEKSRIWFIDLKQTDNFESTRWDFLMNQNWKSNSVSNRRDRDKISTRSRSRPI
jgi:hypothetical protein